MKKILLTLMLVCSIVFSCTTLDSVDLINNTYDITSFSDNCIYITDLNATIELVDDTSVIDLYPEDSGVCVDGLQYDCNYFEYDIVIDLVGNDSVSFPNNNLTINSWNNCSLCPTCDSCCAGCPDCDSCCIYDNTTCGPVCFQGITQDITAPGTFVNFLCGIQLNCLTNGTCPDCDSCCDCKENINVSIDPGDNFYNANTNISVTSTECEACVNGTSSATTFTCTDWNQTAVRNNVTINCQSRPKVGINWMIDPSELAESYKWDVFCECRSCTGNEECEEGEECIYDEDTCEDVCDELLEDCEETECVYNSATCEEVINTTCGYYGFKLMNCTESIRYELIYDEDIIACSEEEIANNTCLPKMLDAVTLTKNEYKNESSRLRVLSETEDTSKEGDELDVMFILIAGITVLGIVILGGFLINKMKQAKIAGGEE